MSVMSFSKQLKRISGDYHINLEQAGCYLVNYNNEYICHKYDGGCKNYERCKEIHNKEKVIR